MSASKQPSATRSDHAQHHDDQTERGPKYVKNVIWGKFSTESLMNLEQNGEHARQTETEFSNDNRSDSAVYFRHWRPVSEENQQHSKMRDTETEAESICTEHGLVPKAMARIEGADGQQGVVTGNGMATHLSSAQRGKLMRTCKSMSNKLSQVIIFQILLQVEANLKNCTPSDRRFFMEKLFNSLHPPSGIPGFLEKITSELWKLGEIAVEQATHQVSISSRRCVTSLLHQKDNEVANARMDATFLTSVEVQRLVEQEMQNELQEIVKNRKSVNSSSTSEVESVSSSATLEVSVHQVREACSWSSRECLKTELDQFVRSIRELKMKNANLESANKVEESNAKDLDFVSLWSVVETQLLPDFVKESETFTNWIKDCLLTDLFAQETAKLLDENESPLNAVVYSCNTTKKDFLRITAKNGEKMEEKYLDRQLFVLSRKQLQSSTKNDDQDVSVKKNSKRNSVVPFGLNFGTKQANDGTIEIYSAHQERDPAHSVKKARQRNVFNKDFGDNQERLFSPACEDCENQGAKKDQENWEENPDLFSTEKRASDNIQVFQKQLHNFDLMRASMAGHWDNPDFLNQLVDLQNTSGNGSNRDSLEDINGFSSQDANLMEEQVHLDSSHHHYFNRGERESNDTKHSKKAFCCFFCSEIFFWRSIGLLSTVGLLSIIILVFPLLFSLPASSFTSHHVSMEAAQKVECDDVNIPTNFAKKFCSQTSSQFLFPSIDAEELVDKCHHGNVLSEIDDPSYNHSHSQEIENSDAISTKKNCDFESSEIGKSVFMLSILLLCSLVLLAKFYFARNGEIMHNDVTNPKLTACVCSQAKIIKGVLSGLFFILLTLAAYALFGHESLLEEAMPSRVEIFMEHLERQQVPALNEAVLQERERQEIEVLEKVLQRAVPVASSFEKMPVASPVPVALSLPSRKKFLRNKRLEKNLLKKFVEERFGQKKK